MTAEAIIVQNLQLLQQNDPFEKIYGFPLTLSAYQKATNQNRAAYIHFLLLILDKPKTMVAFEPSIQLQPFQIKNMDLFKQVSYMQILDIKNSSFDLPNKTEYLNHTPKNTKMLLHFSQQVLQIVFQRLARENNINIQLPQQYTQEAYNRNQSEIIDLYYNGQRDTQLLEQQAAQLSQKYGKLQQNIQTNENILKNQSTNSLNIQQDTQQLFKRLDEYIEGLKEIDIVNIEDKNLRASLAASNIKEDINFTELKYLQSEHDEFINMKNVLKQLAQQLRPENGFPKAPSTVDDTFKPQLEQIALTSDKLTKRLQQLTKQIQVCRQELGFDLNFQNTQNMLKSTKFGSQILKFSLLSVDQCKQKFKEEGKLLTESRIEHELNGGRSYLLKSELQTTNSQVAGNLAQRLKRLLQGNSLLLTQGERVLKGTDVEGIRSYMDMIQ